jgi:hypothetical protein
MQKKTTIYGVENTGVALGQAYKLSRFKPSSS